MRRASKTNTQLDKADHLKREGLPKRELELLLSVLYLEANGPENRGGAEPDLLHEFPPFDPSMAISRRRSSPAQSRCSMDWG